MTHEMKTELATVTPALARQWLQFNGRNRALRPAHVETLRQSFLRGEYVPTHQGICFDEDGELIDGQHRLVAISKMPEDWSCRMLVTRGADRSSVFAVVDTVQAKRSTSDVLGICSSHGETANFLARLYLGRSTITPAFAAPFAEFLRPELEELMAHCGRVVKTWSSAPVKVAALIRMKQGDKEYVLAAYRALVASQFDQMPAIVQALYRSNMSGSIRSTAGFDLFARSFKAFNPENAALKILRINSTADVLDEARSWLETKITSLRTAKQSSRSSQQTAA